MLGCHFDLMNQIDNELRRVSKKDIEFYIIKPFATLSISDELFLQPSGMLYFEIANNFAKICARDYFGRRGSLVWHYQKTIYGMKVLVYIAW